MLLVEQLVDVTHMLPPDPSPDMDGGMGRI